MAIQNLKPDGLVKPAGFVQVSVASGSRMVFVSGQVATDEEGNLVGEGDPVAQARQVFANLKRALEAAGATLDDIAKLTWYVIGDQSEMRPVLAEARRSVLGDREFASTLLGVSALASPEYLFEAEAVAVLD